jgi:rhodanese-related sulfurtransferase
MIEKVQPNQMHEFAPDSIIIDVRTKPEHEGLSLTRPHVHIPLDQLDPKKFIEENNISADTKIYMLCKLGGRATKAAEKFINAGYNNVCVIEGGIDNCVKCGQQTKADANVISLERQVRIAVGSLIALSVILGYPFIAMLFGCALAISGITNWCGMALLLAKAPWNRS